MFSHFSQKALFIVIGLVAVSLIGLVFIQVKWIKSAILINEQKFNERVCTSIYKVEENYESSLNSLLLAENQSDSNSSPLKLLLGEEFARKNLPLDFSVGVFDQQSRRVLGDLAQENVSASMRLPFACTYSLAVYFPGKEKVLLAELSSTLAPSIIFIALLVSSFAYVIITLKKQKKLSAIKNDFINNLTHEFKTPLSSITLTNRVIQKRNPERFDEKDLSYFRIIENESTRLKAQINRVLQMAHLDAGVFTLEKKEINVHDIIVRVAQTFEAIVKETGGSVFLDFKAERPVLSADETHLTNLIYNLMDNGCKYSDRAPEIRIATSNTNEGLCISIKDNGIGMRTEIQKHIFDKFYRAQSGNVHRVKGFGLGLSYVKSIVLAHRGKINLWSEVNKGSEFQVILPLA